MENQNKSKIDIYAPINVTELMAYFENFGPIHIGREGNPTQISLRIARCSCTDEVCNEIVTTVDKVTGLSVISWTMMKDELEHFDSLAAFFDWAHVFGPDSSSGERQLIEHHILSGLGKLFAEVDHPFCACPNCAEKIGETELWRLHLLSALALNLRIREDMLANFDSGDREIANDLFDAGYSLGRMVGEYFLKDRVEEDAKRGIDARNMIEKRVRASGKKSSKKKSDRIEMMIEKMEALARENPMSARLEPKQLAAMAIEDAASEDPKLWSQGQGQVQEYLDEIRADIRWHERYRRLFSA